MYIPPWLTHLGRKSEDECFPVRPLRPLKLSGQYLDMSVFCCSNLRRVRPIPSRDFDAEYPEEEVEEDRVPSADSSALFVPWQETR
jgi:hypothetical protein